MEFWTVDAESNPESVMEKPDERPTLGLRYHKLDILKRSAIKMILYSTRRIWSNAGSTEKSEEKHDNQSSGT